jgi:competence protein ComEC
MVLALGLWTQAGRPVLLISADGTLAGLMGPDGRALSAAKGAGFAAETWLENDGDLALQAEAAARPGFTGPKGARGFEISGVRGVILTGKQALPLAADACAAVQIVVLADVADGPLSGGCLLIDRAFLRTSGALALDVVDGAVRITPARDAARIWAGQGALMAPTPVLTAGPRLASGQ